MINPAAATSSASSPWEQLRAPEPPPEGGWLRRHPSQLDACVEARGACLPPPLDREELEALREAHRLWRADEATMAHVEALGDPRTRVVVAGQQPDLLAGPLLVLYKALAAVKLARELADRHRTLRFVPVFWIASEDHDFDEIRRVFWPGHGGRLEEFLLPSTCWEPGRMVGAIRPQPFLARLIEQIEQTTFRTQWREEVLERLRTAYDDATDLEGGFARLLLGLMAGMGLVLVSPRQGWVRRRARPIFERELRQPGESTRRVLERGRALRAAGLEPQLHRPPTAVNVFWVDADERRFAFRYDAANGKALFLRSLAGRGVDGAAAETIDQPPLDAAEALALLDEDPPPLSANVVTRPVLQDAILPTVAQIVGPGEAAYLAQVEAAYELFDVFVPVRYPRPQALLLEPRVARHLERYGLDAVEAAECDAEALIERVVRRDLESGDLGELTALRREQLEALDRLAARLAKPGSAAEGAFRRLRQAMEKGYDTVAERLLYQHQQDQQHVSQAMATVAASLRPAGAPQERRLNPLVPFAVNYSPAWTAALAARLAIDPSAPMQVIAMSALAADTASVE